MFFSAIAVIGWFSLTSFSSGDASPSGGQAARALAQDHAGVESLRAPVGHEGDTYDTDEYHDDTVDYDTGIYGQPTVEMFELEEGGGWGAEALANQ